MYVHQSSEHERQRAAAAAEARGVAAQRKLGQDKVQYALRPTLHHSSQLCVCMCIFLHCG